MSAANIAVLVLCSFHNPDFVLRQPVKLVDQGIYLALEKRLLVTIFGYMVQGIDLYKQTHQSISIVV
jgi:hypothetical protein